WSFLDLFSDPEVLEALRPKLCRRLDGLRLACYYGCLTSRPKAVTGAAEIEAPMAMDRIMALTGAEPVDWDFKTECCGASHQVDAPAASRPLIGRILENAADCGAEAVVTACPLCAMNLDMRQKEAFRGAPLPVYQFTELLAFCMGAGAAEVGLEKHFTPAFDLINRKLRKAGEPA
ncbi:MAG: heterodisulfide reductase-related iron-sulfur binding cluster, partial [Clostridia bacterium]|nr:heterodisulfide reductase-related iron-sulfur binding cluster [Clostridia bacterium]